MKPAVYSFSATCTATSEDIPSFRDTCFCISTVAKGRGLHRVRWLRWTEIISAHSPSSLTAASWHISYNVEATNLRKISRAKRRSPSRKKQSQVDWERGKVGEEGKRKRRKLRPHFPVCTVCGGKKQETSWDQNGDGNRASGIVKLCAAATTAAYLSAK